MIHIVQNWNAKDHADRLKQMFAMRARIFGPMYGQDVNCVDGQERDILDDASPVYVIATDETDRVVGSCRLLPSTGPTLLESFFSDSMPDGVRLVDPTIWECSRFCVDQEDGEGHPNRLGEVTRSIVRAVADLGLRVGIETIMANLDAVTLRMCREVGYEVAVLGMTGRYGYTVYLVTFSINNVAEVDGERGKANVGVPAPLPRGANLVEA